MATPARAAPLAPRDALWRAAHVGLTLLVSAVLVCAAVVAHAPAAVLPLIVLIVLGAPLVAAWELPRLVATARHGMNCRRALRGLRRELGRLPETRHPL